MFIKKKYLYKALISLAIILTVIFICSCARNTSGDLQKIDFVLDWTPNTNHTGLYVADKLGYFEQEGIRVNIHQPPEDSSTALVGSGRVQFGISFQDKLAQALSRDVPVPVVAVAAVLQHNSSGIVSKKSTAINRPKELENKTCVMWDLPTERAMLKNVVEVDGGNFENVNMVSGISDDVITTLSTNIDALNTYYGWDVISANLKNIDTNFFFFKDINPVFDYYTPVIIANEKYIKENPELTKKFLLALSKGYEFAINNPEESAQILLNANTGLNENLVLKSQAWISKQYKSDSMRWGDIDENRWNNYYNWLYENNLINKNLCNKGFSNEFLPNISCEGNNNGA